MLKCFISGTFPLYELIYKHTRIKPDPQVFLGMVARAQTVDTRPFFFLRAAWVRGYLHRRHTPRNFNVSKLNCLLPLCADNCCLLHIINVCGMQCTSYYIGIYNIILKLVVGMEDQRGFILSN